MWYFRELPYNLLTTEDQETQNIVKKLRDKYENKYMYVFSTSLKMNLKINIENN